MPGDDHSIETLFLRVVLPVRPRPIKITVCSAYRPPNSRVTHWDMFSNSIDSVLTHGLKLIILGDLNIDVLRQQPTSQPRYLEEMCSEFCLTNVVSQPTRIPSNTCLDLALVSSGLLPTSATVVPLDGISDHSLVLLPLSFLGLQLPPRTQCRTIRKPTLANIDVAQCNADLKQSLPNTLSCKNSLDEFANQWISCVKGVLDRNAPLQHVVMPNVLKPKPQPWVTERLRYLLQKRRNLHVKARRDSASGHRWLQYRAVRREGTLLNQQLKSSYYKEHFNAMKGNPRGQWALLNRLSGRAKSQESPKADIGELSATFQEFVTDLHRPSVLDPFHGPPASSAMTVFTPVAQTEVEKMLRCLNTAKASGSDGLPPYLLKHCSSSLAPTLTMIINESLATGTVPDILKLANVCPLHKNGDPYDSRNYRPISLLPIISKLLEKVVHRQLVEHLQHPSNAHGLPHEQFAYRHHHSCEDALTLAVNNWQLMLDEGSVCGVVFADMSKAFDRVDHGLLIQDLHELGISGISLRWFCSYLSSRFQRVTTPTATADTVHCSRGVPQGSVLGPLSVLYLYP